MKFKLKQGFFTVLFVGLGLSVLGQNKHVEVKIPQSGPANEQFQTAPADESKWWEQFNDTILNDLVKQATVNNYDLLTAASRVEAARARKRIQEGRFYPQIAVEAAYSPQQSMMLGRNAISHSGTLGVNASWEVDLIGSIRLRSKSQRESFYASKEDYNDVMLMLRAQVCIEYITLRMYQREWQVAAENLEAQKGTVEITETRFRTGLVSALDVAQANTLYYSTKASIPNIEASIIAQINTLCVLLGQAPGGALTQQLSTVPAVFPIAQPILVPVGVPADLVRRRPDIRSAERQVNASAASLGATKTDWFPKFYVNASAGYASEGFQDLFNSENLYWQIAPSVQWTLFSGRQLLENTRLERANLDQSINSFNKTILTALQETDDAMNAYSKSLEQIVATREAFKQAKRTFDLALDLYKQGLIDFQNLLDAQRNLLSYANSVVSVESSSYICLVQLYAALGGGMN